MADRMQLLVFEIYVEVAGGCFVASAPFRVPDSHGAMSALNHAACEGCYAAIKAHWQPGWVVTGMTVDAAIWTVGPNNQARALKLMGLPEDSPDRWSVEFESGVQIMGLFNRYTIGEGNRNGES